MKMRPLIQDLSIYKKFGLKDNSGVKFLLHKPDGVEQMNGAAGLCEMFWKAQESDKRFLLPKKMRTAPANWQWLERTAAFCRLWSNRGKLDIFQEGALTEDYTIIFTSSKRRHQLHCFCSLGQTDIRAGPSDPYSQT
jgi:hypothetical protein